MRQLHYVEKWRNIDQDTRRKSQRNGCTSYTAAKIQNLARHVAFHQLKSANVLTVNGIWSTYLLDLGNCIASANVRCGPASCCGDCGRILNRVRVEEREQYLMSRRFYHTIPRRALGGNETPLLECLISHARSIPRGTRQFTGKVKNSYASKTLSLFQ